MGYTGERYNSVKFPGQSLAVIECGITICEPLHYTSPRIYPDYAIHFVVKGKGTYVVGEEVFEVSEGQGFLIAPNVICSYTADAEEPWAYIYVVFCGSDADSIVRNAGLDENEPLFEFELKKEFLDLLYSIHNACRKQSSMGYEAIGYFALAMSKLIEQNISGRREYSTAEQYIKKAKAYIEQHYSYNITIQELSLHIGLDRTYLYRLFEEKLKKSPSEYINDFRLKKAVEMMKNEMLTLPNIALSSGFYDYSYFSKRFIKKYKVSPGTYRRSLMTEMNLNDENC